MKVNETIKTMKQINPEVILIVKIGEFYYLYGKDSYIFSYYFKYKIKKAENNIPVCGFPLTALNKVLTKIEEENLNYIIVDKCLNYEVLEEYKEKKNNYNIVFSKANNYIKKKNKIDEIYNKLLNQIENKNINEKILKVEEIVNEV